MDYEKEYKEALERAKAGKPLDEVFPELKESEDERIRKELWEYFHNLQLSSDSDFSPSFTIDDVLSYLDNQKEQKPAEWSEEDENRIKSIKATLEQFAYANNMLDVNGDCCDASMIKNINWLKSLRPQPHWKPSKEQMKALGIAIRCGIQLGTWEEDALRSLNDELKSL